MSVKNARASLRVFAGELQALQDRVKELEAEVLHKSDTLARLEQARDAPVSATVALVVPVVPRITLPNGISLRPTQTKVSSIQTGFPEIEKESSEASEIKPWLYLAGNIVARDADKIKQLGITRILNVAHTVCPNYFEGQFQYTSFDLIDHPSETIDHFILYAISEIEKARLANEKILVHCHQGMSRSASLVIAYIAWKDRLSILDALMYVKSRRKIVSPNAGFMEQLKKFEIKLFQKDEPRPLLYNVAPHSDKVAMLVVKEIYDTNRPLIDEDDVFLLYEGRGGDILIRTPLIETDANLIPTAVQFANWMILYEQAFHASKIAVVPYESGRFLEALGHYNKSTSS